MSQLFTRGTSTDNALHALAAWQRDTETTIYASGVGGYAVGYEESIGWMYRAYHWTITCPEALEAVQAVPEGFRPTERREDPR